MPKQRKLDHIDRFHIERNTRAFYTTQGYKKLCNFVVDLMQKDGPVRFIESLRNRYDIPPGGFEMGEPPWYQLPLEWKHRADRVKVEKMRREIKAFCAKHDLPAKDWLGTVERYAFHGKLSVGMDPNSHNVCYVGDVLQKRDSLGNELSQDLLDSYPVGLLLSPYASKRDILDYVEKIYATEIEPLQKRYRKDPSKFVIGKSRTKRQIIQERNAFIHKNRHLPLKNIMSYLPDRQLIDEGHIGAVRSQERKKRKQA